MDNNGCNKTTDQYVRVFAIWFIVLLETKMCCNHTWKVPRLSSKSASIDQTFNDLYTLFWTGSDASKYSAFLEGMAVAFCNQYH